MGVVRYEFQTEVLMAFVGPMSLFLNKGRLYLYSLSNFARPFR